MQGVTELAKLFKERENVPYLGPQIGEILLPLPEIKIKLGEQIILGKKNIIVANSIYLHYEWSDITGTYYLEKGDKVILIPSTDNQKYYLLDKAVVL